MVSVTDRGPSQKTRYSEFWGQRILLGGARREGGGGGVSSRVHEQQFSVSRVTKQIVYLISATSRLGDLCPAINSLGKPSVGGSKGTEV